MRAPEGPSPPERAPTKDYGRPAKNGQSNAKPARGLNSPSLGALGVASVGWSAPVSHGFTSSRRISGQVRFRARPVHDSGERAGMSADVCSPSLKWLPKGLGLE